MEITNDTRLIDLTVGQLRELFRTLPGNQSKEEPKRYVYGIAGIASLFNCSTRTANRIKSSGIISKAISQRGRTIVVDADMALKLYNKN